jgi:hypothetical protein
MARRFLETGSLLPWLSHHIRCNRDTLPPATRIRLVMDIRRRPRVIRRKLKAIRRKLNKDIRRKLRAIRRRPRVIRRKLRAIHRKLKAIHRKLRAIRLRLKAIHRNSLMDSRDTRLKVIPHLDMPHKQAIRLPVIRPQDIHPQGILLLRNRDTLHKLHIRPPDTPPLVPIPLEIHRPDIRHHSRDISQAAPLRQFQPDRLLVTQTKI